MHVGSKFKGWIPFGVRSTGSYLVVKINEILQKDFENCKVEGIKDNVAEDWKKLNDKELWDRVLIGLESGQVKRIMISPKRKKHLNSLRTCNPPRTSHQSKA